MWYYFFMSERPDAVVALSGDFSPDLINIGPGTQERMDTALALIETHDVPLIVSGNYPFRWRTAPPRPLAHLMKNYAVEQGVPDSMIVVQDSSLDTVGDALCTKVAVTEPRGWEKLKVVTSNAHIPRSKQVFEHVMGPGYEIDFIGSGAAEEVKLQRVQEFLGSVLVRAVLAGTEPGDTAKIQGRLFRIIPGYADVQMPSRLLAFAMGLMAK
jgi:uncharacterized SAM-binding protein YcdF (DUF218 family)